MTRKLDNYSFVLMYARRIVLVCWGDGEEKRGRGGEGKEGNPFEGINTTKREKDIPLSANKISYPLFKLRCWFALGHMKNAFQIRLGLSGFLTMTGT